MLSYLFLFSIEFSLQILSFVVDIEMGGEMNIAAGIQVAQLALKHRQNKNQHQRIIVFAGRYNLLSN